MSLIKVGCELEYNVTGLMPGSYRFEVRALDYSGNASGPAAINVRFKVPPEPPTNLGYSSSGNNWTVTWDAPTGPVSNYRAVLRGMTTGRTQECSPVEPTTEFSLSNIDEGYAVRIFAVNLAGESLPLIGEIILS